MTRDDVTKLFPDATDEQITQVLNAHQSELQTAKKNAEDWKAKAGQAQTLEEQLAEAERLKAEAEKKMEEAENKNLSNEELLQKKISEMEKASNEKIAALTAQLATSEINAYASEKGLSGEHVANVLKAFGGDTKLAKTAINSMCQLKTDWEAEAALAKEKEIQSMSGNPAGAGTGDGKENEFGKQLAVASAKRAGKANENILSQYRR